MICSANEGSTSLSFEVDDGTGRIDVRVWLDSEDNNEFFTRKRATWREGVTVRVYGHLRSFMNQRSVVAFPYCGLRPVEQFDEVTYHFLEVLYVSLFNRKGGVTHQGGKMTSNQGGFEYQKDALSNVQRAVLEVIRNINSPDGASFQFITDQLANMCNSGQVKEAIDFLIGNGTIYTTIDDYHFQCADG
eukprot:TRINITY_DN2509_c0_g1_i2.p1 TRINITY_DN2509_c0_g1~~TRINITY_DN2509_c0_g1_i2.p1  ORF type:complete len:189 (-),score=29.88 TRINITY_DN2509_c0_g1_i2:97-663(-)